LHNNICKKNAYNNINLSTISHEDINFSLELELRVKGNILKLVGFNFVFVQLWCGGCYQKIRRRCWQNNIVFLVRIQIHRRRSNTIFSFISSSVEVGNLLFDFFILVFDLFIRFFSLEIPILLCVVMEREREWWSVEEKWKRSCELCDTEVQWRGQNRKRGSKRQ
jgi:hypothetical protein